MSLTLAPGETKTLTVTVDLGDGSIDSNAQAVELSEDSGGNVITVAGGGGSNGTFTAEVTAVAEGTANVTASFTNPDGSVVSTGVNNPDSVTVTAPPPPPPQNAASVNIAE